MARKGRARRFREARQMKQGFDDGLFEESSRSLADLEDEDEDSDELDDDGWDDEDEDSDEYDWDPDRDVDR